MHGFLNHKNMKVFIFFGRKQISKSAQYICLDKYIFILQVTLSIKMWVFFHQNCHYSHNTENKILSPILLKSLIYKNLTWPWR